MAEQAAAASHDAFISYSRQDRAFAQRLEKALKAWRPPPGLGLPARLLDVFRDESDFTGSDYYAAIEQHLQCSRKLIVLCSPAARASSYVDDEIRRFVRLHGADAVIPLLVAGVPNNEGGSQQASEMAFPAALCEALTMPLATSFLGFDAKRDRPDRAAFEPAWYQLLANLLERSRSEVEQRDRRRQARQRRIVGGIVTAVIAALSVALALTLLARQETERQRAEAVKQRDVAEEQRRIAEDRRKAALARQLNVEADAALREPDARSLQRSLLLRLQSLAAGWTPEGYAALLRSIDRLAPAPHVLLPGPGEPPLGLAFSPDGARLAIGSSRGIRIVDVDRQHELHQAESQGQGAPPVFSADASTLLAACREGRACLWDTARWRVVQRLEGRQEVMSAALAAEGRLFAVAGRFEGSFALVQSSDGRTPAWLVSHAAALARVGQVAFSPDGRWLATQGDGALQLWDLRAQRLALRRSVGRNETALAFSADGALLLHAGDENRPVVARIDTGSPGAPRLPIEVRFVLPRSHVRITPQFSPDGTRLALGLERDRSVALYDIASGSELTRLGPRALGLAWRRDGTLATGHDDGRVMLWAPDRPEARRVEMPGVAALALDDPGRRLALLAAGRLSLVDADSGRTLATAPADAAADQIDFSPDGHWLVARAPRRLRVFAADDLRALRELDGEAADGAASWSADSRWLLVRGSRQVLRLDSRDWAQQPVSFEVSADALATSPDGRWLATHSGWSFARGIGLTQPSMTRVWDLADGRLKAWVSHEDDDLKHSMFVLGRASSASGEWTTARRGGDAALAAAGPGWPRLRTSVEARLPEQAWITSADAQGVTLGQVQVERAARAHRGSLKAWAYSADGRWLASAGGDGTVRLWPLRLDDLAAEACLRIGRNLGDEEWHRHRGDEPYRETCPGLPRGE